jgi:cysteine desulfurase
LDNNATTAIDPRVADILVEELRVGPTNPSSLHASGRAARDRVEAAAETIGRCLNTALDLPGGPRLIFTSGGTESNNLALLGIGDSNSPIVVSRIEHPSVIEVAKAMAAGGRVVRWLDVDAGGRVRLDQLADLIGGDGNGEAAGLVSIMSANNETGIVQPIATAAEICRAAGVPLHVDATQSIGKVDFDVSAIGASAVTFTSHKFHGPSGIGGLWIDGGLKLNPMLRGGQQQLESRPGTEPVALIVAMAESLRIAVAEQSASAKHMRRLRDRFESQLKSTIGELVIHGEDDPSSRHPGTTCVSFLGTDRQTMLMALDMAGIACSSGSTCSSGSSPPSHVLTAMGCRAGEVASALRFGVSKFSTETEIETAAERIFNLCSRLRK